MNVSECVEIIMQRGVFLIMKMLGIWSGEKKKRKTTTKKYKNRKNKVFVRELNVSKPEVFIKDFLC